MEQDIFSKLKDVAKEIFETLFGIDVSNVTEKRKDLTYLSWSHALSETMKRYPDMSYKIRRFGPDELPYQYDPVLGYMVSTEVTIRGITKEMWLPVLDTNNKAMKSEPYTYDTKNVKGIKVEAATYYDINKALMRCLVKNLAAFGLGMYIYNKDDLPEAAAEEEAALAAALADAVKEIGDLGAQLIAKGYAKKDVYAVVAKHNNGEEKPAKIADMDVAEAIKKEFGEMLASEPAEDKPARKPAAKKAAAKKGEDA